MRKYNSKLTIETDHYIIYSTANRAQTGLIAETIEGLYAAYTTFFGNMLPANQDQTKLRVKLYRDREEFKRYNRNSSWAEAFYQKPYCHSYYSAGRPNPYHWMIHEGTHQLSNEVAHFKMKEWIDEGLATYFGTSTIKEGKMILGQVDATTYPIWWLPGTSLTGNIEGDLKDGKIIPLRSLITGKGGPDINKEFNLYYIHYWSLTHFLLHYKHGKYLAGYRTVIAERGSLKSFEKGIGALDRIQGEWYEYLLGKILEVKGQGASLTILSSHDNRAKRKSGQEDQV